MFKTNCSRYIQEGRTHVWHFYWKSLLIHCCNFLFTFPTVTKTPSSLMMAGAAVMVEEKKAIEGERLRWIAYYSMINDLLTSIWIMIWTICKYSCDDNVTQCVKEDIGNNRIYFLLSSVSFQFFSCLHINQSLLVSETQSFDKICLPEYLKRFLFFLFHINYAWMGVYFVLKAIKIPAHPV